MSRKMCYIDVIVGHLQVTQKIINNIASNLQHLHNKNSMKVNKNIMGN